MAFKYMRSPAKDQNELAIKNIMAALKRHEGVPTANAGYVDSLHKMLGLYLNGGPGLRV